MAASSLAFFQLARAARHGLRGARGGGRDVGIRHGAKEELFSGKERKEEAKKRHCVRRRVHRNARRWIPKEVPIIITWLELVHIADAMEMSNVPEMLQPKLSGRGEGQ